MLEFLFLIVYPMGVAGSRLRSVRVEVFSMAEKVGLVP